MGRGARAVAVFLLFAASAIPLTSQNLSAQADPGAAPTFDAPTVPLASINDTGDLWSSGAFGVATVQLVFDPYGNHPALGDGLNHTDGGVGTFNFTALNDPDFPAIASLLTNGRNDPISLMSVLDGGGVATGAFESYWLGKNPDLMGYAVDFVWLVVHNLTLRPEGGGTRFAHNSTWLTWGHQLFVAFVPPTDLDGLYVNDRDYTFVRVSLADPGTAVLEWNGRNESLNGAGTSWFANKTDLPNGEYAYRAWATDLSGTAFSTELRHLTIAVGVWAAEQLAYGFLPDIALDSVGVPHVCYNDGSGIAYAVRTPEGWVARPVMGGTGCSLALDAMDRPHIASAATRFGTEVVEYAFDTAGGWTVEDVASVGPAPFPSIAVDPTTGVPRIAYYELSSGHLKLATRASGTWTSETVDSVGNTGLFPSLAINSAGRALVAYYRSDTADVRFAEQAAGAWQVQTIDRSWVADGGIALALDSQGFPHVAYGGDQYGGLLRGVRYARWTGPGWSTEFVDRNRSAVVSLAIDRAGQPHLAYDIPWGAEFMGGIVLRYATKAPVWTHHIVSYSFGGRGIALAAHPLGSPVILYQGREPSGQLNYAGTDLAPPVLTVTLEGTLARSGWYVSPVVVTLAAQDATSDVARIEFRFDNGSWTGYTGPFVMADGIHRLRVRAVDNAGNIALNETRFRVDTDPLSPTGPYGEVLPYLPPAAVAGTGLATLWIVARDRWPRPVREGTHRRKRGTPP